MYNKNTLTLTRPQLETIQKLLIAHIKTKRSSPSRLASLNAYDNIQKQTKVTHITAYDLIRNPQRLKKLLNQKR